MKRTRFWSIVIVALAIVCSVWRVWAGPPDAGSDPREVIERRLREARGKTRDWVRAGELCEIARKCVELGLDGKATEVASLALRAANSVADDNWRGRARVFAQLAGTYERMGQAQKS